MTNKKQLSSSYYSSSFFPSSCEWHGYRMSELFITVLSEVLKRTNRLTTVEPMRSTGLVYLLFVGSVILVNFPNHDSFVCEHHICGGYFFSNHILSM